MAGLLRQLWAQPHAAYPFRPLAQMCAAWGEEFEQEYAAAGAPNRIDPGLARDGIALFQALPETAEDRVLLCTDLHGDSILTARRAPWLVIDPKPYVGDPAYDVLQHMLNCEDRLAADPAALVTRLAGLAGVDAGRVRLWLFARSVQESIGSPLMRQVARQLTRPGNRSRRRLRAGSAGHPACAWQDPVQQRIRLILRATHRTDAPKPGRNGVTFCNLRWSAPVRKYPPMWSAT